MEQWLQEYVEKIIASEACGIGAQQITYESVEAFSEEACETAMADCLKEIAEQTLREEQDLVLMSSDLTSMMIDNEIKLLASEELQCFINQVELSYTLINSCLRKLTAEVIYEEMQSQFKIRSQLNDIGVSIAQDLMDMQIKNQIIRSAKDAQYNQLL